MVPIVLFRLVACLTESTITTALSGEISSASRRNAAAAIVIIATLSGFAGLGYEIVWARLFAVALGHEIVAVLGVVTALFAGLALGSLVAGSWISHSRTPARWYAVLELVIGLWALAAIPLLPAVADAVPVLLPLDSSPAWQWTVAFALPFVLLLPATAAMGGTLPALDAMLAPLLPNGRSISHVYAANTFGAVVGTLATTFLLIRFAGLSATLGICASVNFACAIATWRWMPRQSVSTAAAAPTPTRSAPVRASAALAQLFITGLLGIGYEVLTIRVVSQVLENTIYTFAILLAVYLLGTAIGASIQRRLAAWLSRDVLTASIALTTSACCVTGIVVLGYSEAILAFARDHLPPDMAGRLGAEFILAVLVFLPPTIAMGALFTQLAQHVHNREGSLGRGLAVNTLGAALAPILFGPIILPSVGAKTGLAIIAAGYLLALPHLRLRTLAFAVPFIAAIAFIVQSPLSLRFVKVAPGGSVIWHRDGVMAAVSVIQDPSGARHLQVNNHFRMGGDASIRSDYREAHIPLLLHANPKRALFLGLGTGTTLSAAAEHPDLVVDGVELVPEVVESFPLFSRSAPNVGASERLRIHVSDARRFARTVRDRYDVVVADLYHPSIDGAGSLYTREHFAAIKARLTDDGLFCQWLPLYQLDLPTLQIIVRTFLDVFPDATAYLAQFSTETPLIGLVGGVKKTRYRADWLTERLRDRTLAADLAALDLKNNLSLFGLYLADASDLGRFAGNAPINNDDHPVVTAEAPRAAYGAGDTPGERLMTLLKSFQPKADDILQGDDTTKRRLTDYWRARDQYLDIGSRAKMGGDVRAFIAQVAPQLVDVVRLSRDFDAAYTPVLAMARQLARSDPAAARTLLKALDEANPARPEARRLLAVLPVP